MATGKDRPEKGAIVQRDRTTYGIAPHTPAGIVTPEVLRRIADVAEKYQVGQIKLTSAQRIALLGLPEEELDAVWADLGIKPGAPLGLCVRSVKICPGNDWCKRGQQDSVRLGLEVDRRYHGRQLPWKFKMGVSGCANDCAEVCLKDLGLIGTARGWHLMIGGNGGAAPRLARRLIEHVPGEEEALAMLERLVSWFAKQNRKCRLGKLLDEVGEETLRRVALGEE
ncbi:nitrite/sulfite reductase ferredoxin-like protein [Geothermobacter ehrlichii]|uniref:Nitrite/sulfite reductase ferredoxin-like protein n=1 Tax=Geothermobacter ehrlichii TaxID=213224 RepID=A0A5D3WJ93_9BACT|nr:NAD(P)/FAD-dependent oxidoreductase [Geothermobacter ehrlichii]TYO99006.1 nitrite/sulfite reductase ferredoxin-like protein [Geothermobacter ehrlichii]